ncbi:hypothetical protein PGIGA_G00205800, partial [Pangasianodon gigas]|nr:hypothetical protein [Pangasianodon gigas]
QTQHYDGCKRRVANPNPDLRTQPTGFLRTRIVQDRKECFMIAASSRSSDVSHVIYLIYSVSPASEDMNKSPSGMQTAADVKPSRKKKAAGRERKRNVAQLMNHSATC